MYDVFISHASEDKARFVDAFVAALRERGLQVWYDSNEIRVGDDFRVKMDEGLSKSRFGVVVLSPSFFKYWPQAELSALFNQEAAFDQTRILPIRLDLDRATLTVQSPLLATRAALGWELGIRALAERVHERVRGVSAVARSIHSPVYNAPARRSQQLFGREPDLQRVEELLVLGRSVRVAASIEGLAGVGKSELALHIVDRLSETGRFPGGIFWFDAEDPDLTVTWGTSIAEALAVGPGTVEERAAHAVRIASSNAPILVVLDNVERWTRDSEPSPLPRGPHTALLVTTRHKYLAGSSFAHHTLDTLLEQPARQFLFFIAGRDLTRLPGTDDLLRHLDGHSLAVELAGVYLREFPTVTPAAYLERLTEGMPVEEKVKDLVRYEATVRRALDVHWAHLDDTARETLLIAACFAPEDATPALLAACGTSIEAQQPLRRFHLITGDSDRWRMHRLVREWARRTALPENLALATYRFVEGCAKHVRQISLQEVFGAYQTDGPHLKQAARDVDVALSSDDKHVSWLLEMLATSLQWMGDLRGAKDLLERALALDLKNLGENHSAVANSRSNLAIVLRQLGDLPRAQELLERALSSDLKIPDEDRYAVIIRRSNLALVLQNLGDLPRAQELLEQALSSALRTLGADDVAVASIKSNLALVLQDQGDLPRARDLLVSALESSLKSFSEDHPSVAISRSNLALVSRALGDLPRAKELLECALASDLKNFGEDHPSVAKGRSNLAVVLKALGDLPRAQDLLERALASDLKTLGQDHPSVAVRRFNLATLARDVGDLTKARALFAQTLAAEERSLGTDHPSTSFTRVSLANVLDLLGETNLGRGEAERALRAVASQPEASRARVHVERIAERILRRS